MSTVVLAMFHGHKKGNRSDNQRFEDNCFEAGKSTHTIIGGCGCYHCIRSQKLELDKLEQQVKEMKETLRGYKVEMADDPDKKKDEAFKTEFLRVLGCLKKVVQVYEKLKKGDLE